MSTDEIDSYGRELASLSLRGSVLIGLRSALRASELSAETTEVCPQPAERESRLRVAAKWVVLGRDAPDAAEDLGAAATEAYLACTRSDQSRSALRWADHFASLFAKSLECDDERTARHRDEAAAARAAAEDAARSDVLHAARAAQCSALAAALSGPGDTERAVLHSLGAIVYASRAAASVRQKPRAGRPSARDAFDAATVRDLDAIRTHEPASPEHRPSMLTLGSLWAPDLSPPPGREECEGPYGCALEIDLPNGVPLDDAVAWSRRLLACANSLSLAQGGGGLLPRTVEVTSRRDERYDEGGMPRGRILRIVLECLRDDPPEQTRILLADILHAQTLVRAARGVSDSRAWIRGRERSGHDAGVDAQILQRLRAAPGASPGSRPAMPHDPSTEGIALCELRDALTDAPRQPSPGRHGPFVRGEIAPLGHLLFVSDIIAGRATLR